MKTITVKSQSEFNLAIKDIKEYTVINIRDCKIIVSDKIENSSVVARENSSVVARENSSVEAWGNNGVNNYSNGTVLLLGYAVAWVHNKIHKTIKKSKTANIILVKTQDWFDSHGIKKTKYIILYKRVSNDFKTQEKTQNETLWAINSTVKHQNWNPTQSECGEGKFHACPRPYFCDEFRNKKDDKYIAIKVALKDTFVWKNAQYPHKIAFSEGVILYECDKFGKKIG
jgi:hypothetical protein